MNKVQGKFIDLTGQVFGETTVIRRVENIHHQANFLVRCSCGKENSVRGGVLRSGRHTKCRSCAAPNEKPSMRLRPFEALFNTAQKKAIKRNIVFSLTYEQFVHLCRNNAQCHYCDAHLNFAEYNVPKHGYRYQLDRKDNEMGYTAENSVTCCWRCNFGKGSNFTYEEWFGMTQYFRNNKTATATE